MAIKQNISIGRIEQIVAETDDGVKYIPVVLVSGETDTTPEVSVANFPAVQDVQLSGSYVTEDGERIKVDLGGASLSGVKLAGSDPTAITTLQNAATGNGNGTAFDVTNLSSVIFEVSGTYRATINFEGSIDGTTYFPLTVVRLNTGEVTTTTGTAGQTGLFRASVIGLTSVRARISGFSSGSGNVTVRAIGKAEDVSERSVMVSGRISQDIVTNEIRDTSELLYYVDHAKIGAFDLMLIVDNSLDSAVRLKIFGAYNIPSNRVGNMIWGSSTEYNVPAGARFIFTPEKGVYQIESATNKTFELPEFRQPYWMFQLAATAQTAPTTGDLKYIITRRY